MNDFLDIYRWPLGQPVIGRALGDEIGTELIEGLMVDRKGIWIRTEASNVLRWHFSTPSPAQAEEARGYLTFFCLDEPGMVHSRSACLLRPFQGKVEGVHLVGYPETLLEDLPYWRRFLMDCELFTPEVDAHKRARTWPVWPIFYSKGLEQALNPTNWPVELQALEKKVRTNIDRTLAAEWFYAQANEAMFTEDIVGDWTEVVRNPPNQEVRTLIEEFQAKWGMLPGEASLSGLRPDSGGRVELLLKLANWLESLGGNSGVVDEGLYIDTDALDDDGNPVLGIDFEGSWLYVNLSTYEDLIRRWKRRPEEAPTWSHWTLSIESHPSRPVQADAPHLGLGLLHGRQPLDGPRMGIPLRDQKAWFEANVAAPGELQVPLDVYRLLDEQPLLLPSEEFEPWGRALKEVP